MNEYIFTFGAGHTLANCFVRVHAATEAEAREKMFATYGSLWAFQYNTEYEAGVVRHNLTQVPFGTPNERKR